MADSFGERIEYGDFLILPYNQSRGFAARIRRKDMRHFTSNILEASIANHLHDTISTKTYPTLEEAIVQAKLVADASRTE